MQVSRVLGLMSGTSLDGVDFCLVEFSPKAESYKVIKAVTVEYNFYWQKMLAQKEWSSADLLKANVDLADYFSALIIEYFKDETIDLIASHGHTIFHQPNLGYTYQIGHGGVLAKKTGIPVVSDFRSEDIALGGQGAPLVPIGDRDLFKRYDACLNLGGFANVSFDDANVRKAYDICPLNTILNALAKKEGKDFDAGGQMARSGQINKNVLNALNRLDYYQLPFPKSLGVEWSEMHVWPILSPSMSVTDLLATYTEHAGFIIGSALSKKQTLVTGGGVYNAYLLERIKNYTKSKIEVPNTQTIEFKEAIIFAYLGWLRWYGQINILSSVTGAKKDSVGGTLHSK